MDFDHKKPDDQSRKELIDLQTRLFILQNFLYESGKKLIILIEGFPQTGKAKLIRTCLSKLDPKKIQFFVSSEHRNQDSLYPQLKKYWEMFPKKGRALLISGSWYTGLVRKWMTESDFANGFTQEWTEETGQGLGFLRMERTLAMDGFLIRKYFLQLSEETLAHRLEKAEKAGKYWEASPEDKVWLKNYKPAYLCWKRTIMYSDQPYSEWVSLNSEDLTSLNISFLKDLVLFLETSLNVDSQLALKELNRESITE